MAADWGTFVTNMKLTFATPNEKTIEDIAKIHATEYINAVKTATTIMTYSKASMIESSKGDIQNSFLEAFKTLQKIESPLSPNYKGDSPNPNQDKDRSKIEEIFLPVAKKIKDSWEKEIFTPATMPPPYVSPNPGYKVSLGGDPIELSKGLAYAFFISQKSINSESAAADFLSALVKAYTKHLLTIVGVFNGLIPSPGGPVPGPPFPFIGVA